MTAGVGRDKSIVTEELLAPSMNPIFMTASATVEKEQRFPAAIGFVKHFNAVERHRIGLHGGAF
jgi:hypothetical protein